MCDLVLLTGGFQQWISSRYLLDYEVERDLFERKRSLQAGAKFKSDSFNWHLCFRKLAVRNCERFPMFSVL